MSKPQSIIEARAALESGALTPASLVKQTLENIDQWEESLNAFIETLPEEAQAQAAATSQPGRLAGIPIAIKDIICTVEGHTTAGSKILQNFQALFDATVVKRLKREGAIIIGKTNCDEFAMGASNEYSAYGPVKNPWDLSRVPGGSSGGSAAAVASGEVLAALGSDTGGSIRLPASFCGVVGLKPTYGRVSRFGVIAYASSFDQVGPITRTVKDAALLLEILAGQDDFDATTSAEPVDSYVNECGRDIKGLTIGLPQEYFGEEVHHEVVATVSKAIKQLEALGAKTKKISLPLMSAAVPTYYLLVKAEASSNLARYDGLRFGQVDVPSKKLLEQYLQTRGKYFGPEVKRSILMGTYVLSAGYGEAWYKQASRVRTLIRREFQAALKDVDIIAGPVAAEVAFPLGSKAADPLQMYLADLLTGPASVAGLPAMSVPCGFTNGLPVGLQLIAPHFQEELLFRVGHAYEQATDWHQQRPKLPSAENK
ncbi:Asp-tRNA(Asn)/Glu-tRNA(Gln) amidotransferase subunit GatA [Patescibacteria group bacterium]|nr:Asp-tRNA(Asn)/Glu-tRNA(Gln) amidotransferase subunit GatA [Patescibacteria group bacterium]